MEVRVIRHVPFEDLGRIAPALQRRGIAYHYTDSRDDPEIAIEGCAGLILMGGPQSANDPDAYIRREIELLRAVIPRGLPVLGICLGAQLVAKALGAPVYRNPVKEIGWFEVHWETAAARDPLFSGLANPETVFHWHGETFDLPPGAVHLGSSKACRQQAFRFGSHVYGLQFHLEVTPDMIEGWCLEDANCGDVRELEAPLDAHYNAARLAELSDLVFGRWADLVAGRSHHTPGISR